MPGRELRLVDRSLHEVLRDAAVRRPERTSVAFVGEPPSSNDALWSTTRAFAGALRQRGVAPGDRVLVYAGNRIEFVIAIFACSLAGAIAVPLNTAWQNPQAAKVLEETRPTLAVLDLAFASHFDDALHRAPGMAMVALDEAVDDDTYETFDDVLRTAVPIEQPHPPRPDDPALILYTSGTTGVSKGVVLGQRMCMAMIATFQSIVGYRDEDVSFTAGPIFHVNALFCSVLAPLAHDASAVVAPRFSASRFWEQVVDHGATVLNLMGNMSGILLMRPAEEMPAEHRVRLAFGPSGEFARRFGLDARSRQYGLTDAGVPIFITPEDAAVAPPTSCGRPGPLIECALVDDDDRIVPDGEIGELVLRPRHPHVMSPGYWGMPEATVRAWRNLWFHTGDYLRRDEDGWYYFVDRKSDAIRRSGENISSYEVEQAVRSHPVVDNVAAFGVPGELGGEEVMVVLTVKRPAELAPADVASHCRGLLPSFAVPRYVEIAATLPLTQTGKVAKSGLRARGVTAATWDGRAS